MNDMIARFRADCAANLEVHQRYWGAVELQGGRRFDADMTLAVANQLTHISKEIVETLYQPIRFRQHIPGVLDQPSPIMTKYDWYRSETTGVAEWAASLQGSAKRVDFGIDPVGVSTPLAYVRDSFAYDDDELAVAAGLGIAISTHKPAAARSAIERLKNAAAYSGVAANGLIGLFSDANVPEDNVGAVFTNMTAATATEALLEMIDDVWLQSSQVYDGAGIRPDRILLPPTEYRYASRLQFTDGTGDTVLERVAGKGNADGRSPIMIDWCAEAATASDTNGPCAIVYPFNPLVLGYVESVVYRESPPHRKGFSTDIEAYGKFGGVAIRQPLAMKKIGLDS